MIHFLSLLFPLLQADSVLLKHDKIYAVLTVILIIFFALLFYLWRTDKKVSQLEKKVEELEK